MSWKQNLLNWIDDQYGTCYGDRCKRRKEAEAEADIPQEQEPPADVPQPPPPVIPTPQPVPSMHPIKIDGNRFRVDGALYVPCIWTAWQLFQNKDQAQERRLCSALKGAGFNVVMAGDDGTGINPDGSIKEWYRDAIWRVASTCGNNALRLLLCVLPVRYANGKPYSFLKSGVGRSYGKAIGSVLQRVPPRQLMAAQVHGLDDRVNGKQVVPTSVLTEIARGIVETCGCLISAHPCHGTAFAPPDSWGPTRFATAQTGHRGGTFSQSFVASVLGQVSSFRGPVINEEPCYEGMKAYGTGQTINGTDVEIVARASVKYGCAGLGYGNVQSWPAKPGSEKTVAWPGAKATVVACRSVR